MKSNTLARTLRKKQTDAERLLWGQLRAGRLGEVKFRRQHSVGPYFADFCSIEEKLIVELDGGQHAIRCAEDATRTDFLEKRGFKVIRFWDHEVLQSLEAVLESIRTHLIKSPSPQPSPSRGEGGKMTRRKRLVDSSLPQPSPSRERVVKKRLAASSLSPGGEGRVRGNHSNPQKGWA
jgi:very-short-patch-repair endonuclease